jgi:CRP-like cAMP-binding protein
MNRKAEPSNVERVAASELFAELPAALQAELAALLRPCRVEAGAWIYRRGEAPEGFYHVARGRVRFTTLSPDGREYVLDYAEEGAWFGEIGLFDGGPRVVDAIVDVAGELLVVPRDPLVELAHREPAILVRMIHLLTVHVRKAGELLVDSAFLGLGPRLVRRLLQLADMQVPSAPADATVEVRVAQDELGRLCGGCSSVRRAKRPRRVSSPKGSEPRASCPRRTRALRGRNPRRPV